MNIADDIVGMLLNSLSWLSRNDSDVKVEMFWVGDVGSVYLSDGSVG